MELRLTLMRQWPGSHNKQEDVNRSAMDCAVVVLRAIFAHLDPMDLAKRDGDNALVTFAWSDFSAETEEAAAAVQKAREDMFAIIQKEWSLPEPITCLQIMESVPMLRTLWRQDRMRLFQPILCRDGNVAAEAQRWTRRSQTDEELVDEARHSLVCWYHNIKPLANVVSEKFGVFQDANGVDHGIWSNTPDVIRVWWTWDPPIHSFIPAPGWAQFEIDKLAPQYKLSDRDGYQTMTFDVEKDEMMGLLVEVSYRILAMVGGRLKENDQDNVALYDMQGNDVEPCGNVARTASFYNVATPDEADEAIVGLLYYIQQRKCLQSIKIKKFGLECNKALKIKKIAFLKINN